jgi:CDP-glycerol glycerophosphotransferase
VWPADWIAARSRFSPLNARSVSFSAERYRPHRVVRYSQSQQGDGTLFNKVLRLVARTLHVAMALTPARRHVFVSSWPTEEGNGVEIVRALLKRYRGRVVWVDPPCAESLVALGLEPRAIVRLPKNSVRAIIAFVTAEASFFTHGVYGCPQPVAHKPMINMWHGDGPKGHTGAPVPSTYIVSGSSVFGQYRAEQFGVDRSRVILSGMPRNSGLSRPIDHEQRRALGMDQHRPYILWMPTYRQAHGRGLNRSWADLENTDSDQELGEQIAPGLRALMDLGLQVVVKPHPLDKTSRSTEGLVLVSDADLLAARASTYSLLGGAAALLTDYSSVWTDFLNVDRPIAFFMPDLSDYLAKRGLYPPDAMEHLPGRTLTTVADFRDIGREVLGLQYDAGAAMRRDARAHFGLVQVTRPADALLEELAERGVLSLGAPGHE